MVFGEQRLSDIYDRTSGYCHICRKKLAFKNYGVVGARAAWEVEHSNPQAHGGTHRLNNLYAACIRCNRSKGKASTKKVRAKHGRTKAPLSVTKRAQAKMENAVVGAGSGAFLGARIAGPAGAVLGGILGAIFGGSQNPDL